VEPDDADDVEDLEPFDDDVAFGLPPAPDDRLWRHPSELAPGTAATANRRSSRSHRWTTVVLAAAAGSLGTVGVLAVSGALDLREPGPRQTIVIPAVSTDTVRVADPITTITSARTAMASVVRIEVISASSAVLGSGVLFRSDGHVLTNAHVVDGAQTITVELADGRRIAGTLVGSDPETDIAVVQLQSKGPFPVARFASVGDVSVGQPAMVVGAPRGTTGIPTMSAGLVSGLGQEIHSDTGLTLLDMIQTDATVSPGSSGGALLDEQGRVIGICTAYSVTDGEPSSGYATPAELAQAVADDLVDLGSYRPGWLGVRGADHDNGGVTIVNVLDGSPAAVAGLAPGDVVMAIDKRPVDDMSAMRIAMRVRHPGDQITISYERNGRLLESPMALAPRPTT
jgi:S1-C subfamily serine protease